MRLPLQTFLLLIPSPILKVPLQFFEFCTKATLDDISVLHLNPYEHSRGGRVGP